MNYFTKQEKQLALTERVVAQTKGITFAEYLFQKKLEKHTSLERLAAYTCEWLSYPGKTKLSEETKSMMKPWFHGYDMNYVIVGHNRLEQEYYRWSL